VCPNATLLSFSLSLCADSLLCLLLYAEDEVVGIRICVSCCAMKRLVCSRLVSYKVVIVALVSIVVGVFFLFTVAPMS
jgi:hypothetical protein